MTTAEVLDSLAAKDPRYAALRDGRPIPPRETRRPTEPRRTPLPCIHEGRSTRPPAGRDPRRSYLDCEAGLGVVCRCDCGPQCAQYESEEPWHAGSDAFLRSLGSYPEGRWSGRGIVIAAGGQYWPSAYVAVRMVRHVGCALPIQIWYLGARGERDERYERLLNPLGVECVDADRHPARPARRIVNGFELKLFAAINSPWEEILFLDADNYPCADPTALFEDPRYRASGGIYWPDLPKTNSWTRWRFWGVSRFGPDCGFETGQYVLHKRVAWQPMMLAEWYDDRSDQCYGHVHRGDHGDKGPHRVAWAKLRRVPVVFSTRAVWRAPAFVQTGPTGEPLFIHRCRSKFVLDPMPFSTTPQNGPNQAGGFPLEGEAFRYLEELRAAIAR